MARRCRHWGLITGSAFKSTSNGHIDRKVSTDHENWSETSFQVSLGFTIYAKGDLFITSHVLQIDSLAIWQDISLSVAWRFLHIDPETFYGRHTLQKVSKKSSSSPKWDWRAGVGHPAWKQDPSPAYRAASVRFYERAFIFLRTDFPGRFWKTSGTKRGKRKLRFSTTVQGTLFFWLFISASAETHVLFSSFAFLPSFATLGVGHFGSETGNIVEALLGIPLLPTLLASKAKLLVLVFSLGIGAIKITIQSFTFCENATNK